MEHLGQRCQGDHGEDETECHGPDAVEDDPQENRKGCRLVPAGLHAEGEESYQAAHEEEPERVERESGGANQQGKEHHVADKTGGNSTGHHEGQQESAESPDQDEGGGRAACAENPGVKGIDDQGERRFDDR